MTTTIYNIDHTDPLVPGFTISSGGFNGPGGDQADSTLRLYGRNALEWGEAVNEDLLRLTETFSGATPPLHPISGQQWYSVEYYWHDSAQLITAGWSCYNPSLKTWSKINGNGIVPSSPVANPTIGSYYVNTTTGTLYMWDSAYKQEEPSWLERVATMTNVGDPQPTQSPLQGIRTWDAYTQVGSGVYGKWVSSVTVYVQETAPDPKLGRLWWDVTTSTLKVWNGSAWVHILGPNGGTSTGAINMNNFHITNLPNTTPALGDKKAVNGESVYTAVLEETTMRQAAFLYLQEALTYETNARGLADQGLQDQIDALSGGFGGSLSGYLPLSGGIMTGQLIMHASLTLNGNPVNSLDAVTKQYVDALSFNANGSFARVHTSGNTGNDGDIKVENSIIYIRANNTWQQVWPAQYS